MQSSIFASHSEHSNQTPKINTTSSHNANLDLPRSFPTLALAAMTAFNLQNQIRERKKRKKKKKKEKKKKEKGHEIRTSQSEFPEWYAFEQKSWLYTFLPASGIQPRLASPDHLPDHEPLTYVLARSRSPTHHLGSRQAGDKLARLITSIFGG